MESADFIASKSSGKRRAALPNAVGQRLCTPLYTPNAEVRMLFFIQEHKNDCRRQSRLSSVSHSCTTLSHPQLHYLANFKVERVGTSRSACVYKIACGFRLQYADRTNQSAADFVSKSAHTPTMVVYSINASATPSPFCNEASSSPHKLRQTITHRYL